ncbi:Ppx/GppA phosphatase family protein [Sunxiuqinia sp. sy24]|uniref:Ppx/GppA phosphatase family protein n=1 Tax=Sunxiuqinia sp. sy24 TaxID=3461495 RepID=UPI0040456760
MKLAIIDLGTNTCNLLIAEITGKSYTLLHQGKVGVKLGKGGINQNTLPPEAFDRATAALHAHKQTIARYSADKTLTLATSAVRDATNQAEFTQHLLIETGLTLETISGEREAQLIFEGVQLALGKLPDHSLIMDIGGGSNEFIEPRNDKIFWKASFPLGMARVLEQLPISDPIKPDELEAVESWFQNGLEELWEQLDAKPVNQLIGCSGAFDTLADLLDETPPGVKTRQQQVIPLHDFNRIADQVIYSTKAQRDQMIGMEPLRVEMIVPALILIRLSIQRLGIREILQTDYALREGVLFEWIND